MMILLIFISLGFGCFHESTLITFGNETYDLQDIQAGKLLNCSIIRIVKSNGLRVHTDCNAITLRLTNDHLVYSVMSKYDAPRLMALKVLQINSILFNNMAMNSTCLVTRIDQDLNQDLQQSYFELNCTSKDLLANSFKTSIYSINKCR